MNPLGIPFRSKKSTPTPTRSFPKWARDPEEALEPIPSKPKPPPTIFEEKEQALRDAEHVLTIRLQGVGGGKVGDHQIPYDPGQNLGAYLSSLGLKQTGIKNAVYDLSNLEIGRRRMSYVPTTESVILICSRSYSPLSHLQRSSFAGDAAYKTMGTNDVVQLRPGSPVKQKKKTPLFEQI